MYIQIYFAEWRITNLMTIEMRMMPGKDFLHFKNQAVNCSISYFYQHPLYFSAADYTNQPNKNNAVLFPSLTEHCLSFLKRGQNNLPEDYEGEYGR